MLSRCEHAWVIVSLLYEVVCKLLSRTGIVRTESFLITTPAGPGGLRGDQQRDVGDALARARVQPVSSLFRASGNGKIGCYSAVDDASLLQRCGAFLKCERMAIHGFWW